MRILCNNATKNSTELGLQKQKYQQEKNHYFEIATNEFSGFFFFIILDVTFNALKNRFSNEVIEQFVVFENS